MMMGVRRRLLGAIPALGAAALLAGCGHAPHRYTAEEANLAQTRDPVLRAQLYGERAAHRLKTPTYAAKAWEWFNERRIGFAGLQRMPAMYRQEALAETMAVAAPRGGRASAQWTAIPPTGGVQPSGRLIELAVHPTNDSIIYAASASGGIWKTTNQGGNWTNVTDGFLPSIGMGSVEVDRFNPNIVYCGLGEGVPGSHYEPYGAGVYKSTDAGATWTFLSSTSTFEYVADIRVVGDSNTLLAATGSYIKGSANAGLYRSTNGGQTWTQVSNVPFFSVSVDPANPNNVVASSGYFVANQTAFPAQIYYSTNGGANFAQASIPSNAGSFRIELARSGTTLYALSGGTDAGIQGIWKSTNNGQNWTALPTTGIPSSGDYKPGQMYYNNSIGVAPGNANTVFIGSNLRAYKSTNGGQSWTAVSDWAGGDGLSYMHADHHSIRFGANDNTVFFGNDGGFFRSTNGGTTWEERNTGYDALQIYRMDNSQTNANVLIAGLQDNDKYIRRADGSWNHYPNTWGDGMEMIAHPSNLATFMGANYYGGAVQLTEDNAANWYLLRTYGRNNNGIPDDEKGAWVVPFLYDPQSPNTLYLGLQDIYRCTYTPGFLPSWSKVVDFGPERPAQMELLALTHGTSNRKMIGFVGRRNDQGQLSVGLWRAGLDGSGAEFVSAPNSSGWISALTTDPNANLTVWAGYSDINSGIGNRGRIYKSTDLGTTWTNMTNNFPQNLPVNAIWIDPNNSQTVIVGSDIGVYRSDNGGGTWSFWNEGMPKVVVTDFSYFPPGRKLRAATYGRGIYETPVDGVAANPDIRISPEALNFP